VNSPRVSGAGKEGEKQRMPGKCGGELPPIDPKDPCSPPEVGDALGRARPAGPAGGESGPSCGCGSSARPAGGPAAEALEWFGGMINRCTEYAEKGKREGRPVVGFMCEVTPRELILAAGGIPVLLCGGSARTAEEAEEVLPANLCPLIKSTFGYHLDRSNPLLEAADLLVGDTTCDGKKKMFELLAGDRPLYILEYPQKADDPDALDHWERELGKFKAELETRLGKEITKEGIREAIRLMNRERRLRRELASLMKADPPPLSGRQLLEMKSIVSCVPGDLAMYERALDLLRDAPAPAEHARRPRVLLTGVPMVHGAERVLEIIEDSGGIVVAQESCTGLKPLVEDVDEDAADPLRALAEKYFHMPCSVRTPNGRRMDLLRSLAKEYRVHCVIDLVWQACITYDVESALVKALCEEELGIPYLRILTDYSPSDSARIAVRVEALFETLRVPGHG